jgi:hypothetical protein
VKIILDAEEIENLIFAWVCETRTGAKDVQVDLTITQDLKPCAVVKFQDPTTFTLKP